MFLRQLFHHLWIGIGMLAVGLMVPVSVHAAAVLDVASHTDTGKTEITISLSEPVNGMVLNQSNPNQVTVSFPGEVYPFLKASNIQFESGRHVRSVSWKEVDGRVQFVVHRNGYSSFVTRTVNKPHQLTLVASERAVKHPVRRERSQPLIPGVAHRHIVKQTLAGPLNINVLDIDLNQPGIKLEPVMANASGVHGKAKVVDMVQWYQAFAGINASFFKPDTGTIIGTTIMGRDLVAGPIYDRVCFGMTDKNRPRMARLSFEGQLATTDGRSIAIHNLNQPRLSKKEYIVYTHHWGNIPPKTPKNGIQILVRGDRVVRSSTERLPIPKDGYVILGPSKGLALALQPGDTVDLTMHTTPNWSDVTYAVSGGPYLVKYGQPFVDFDAEHFRSRSFLKRAPRTAIGVTRDNHVLLVTVDGRKKNVSVGMTLHELSGLMMNLGAVHAMNLDGGSSTQMVVQDKLVNRPTVKGGARVSNALIIRQVAPPLHHQVIGVSIND